MSKCRYQDLGEKLTKYFLNLERRNYTTINKLIVKTVKNIQKVMIF